MRNTADVTGGKPIAVLLQPISGVSAINPLVAFYDIHEGKRELLFFYFVPDTTRDCSILFYEYIVYESQFSALINAYIHNIHPFQPDVSAVLITRFLIL
jgi:hypothetical protein